MSAAGDDKSALAAPNPKAEAARFLRFCLVGVAGFVADAGVLKLLVHLTGANPIAARLPSFAFAVLVTFELNRRWAFGAIRHGSILAAFAAYVSVQGVGFLSNLAVYTALILWLPAPFDAPLLCLAIASVAALLVNYSGARRLVFGKS